MRNTQTQRNSISQHRPSLHFNYLPILETSSGRPSTLVLIQAPLIQGRDKLSSIAMEVKLEDQLSVKSKIKLGFKSG